MNHTLVRTRRFVAAALALLVAVSVLLGVDVSPAAAQVEPPPPELNLPNQPVPDRFDDTPDLNESDEDGFITVDIGNPEDGPGQSVMLILVITLLGVAPSILIMMTSFSRIIIVLSLTRNALGLQGIPPNQILIGLALFLSLFVMAPTLSEINDVAFQPYLDGQLEQGDAFDAGSAPLREFMLEQTRTAELEMMLDARGGERPEGIDDLGLDVVVPAFILSELRTAFTIGFVLFIPFLVVDLVVSAVLMSLGMMMLPPVFVSLPFKLLLFVMVGGWTLLVETLLSSFV